MRKVINIIGGGTSGLFLGCFLDEQIFDIRIYDSNKALGRKFLVAGDGGFNLTHGEENLESFTSKYVPEERIRPFIQSFTNQDFRKYLAQNGIPTYVGTSKRVYPEEGIKPIEVLNALLEILRSKAVTIFPKHQWKGFEAKQLLFEVDGQTIREQQNITVFALGGASWSVTGSKGDWLQYFETLGIKTKGWQAANASVVFSEGLRHRLGHLAGQPLKNVQLTLGQESFFGEFVFKDFGAEGGIIYQANRKIREEIEKQNAPVKVILDLKPSMEFSMVYRFLHNRPSRLSISDCLREQIKLSNTAIALIKSMLNIEDFRDSKKLTAAVKALEIEISGFGPIEDAISTVGGIPWQAVNPDLSLKQREHLFVLGEMIDWDCPTGGYLIQGCVSMAHALAIRLNHGQFSFSI